MSASLLKKSLQIVEESENVKKKNKTNLISKSSTHEKNLKRLNNIQTEEKTDPVVLKAKEKKRIGLDKNTAEMLFQYARGETRNNLIEEKRKKKKKEQEESVFTEEDFQKFEREYFG